MSLWILDTDTLSLFQNQHLLVKKRVNQVRFQEIAVTMIISNTSNLIYK